MLILLPIVFLVSWMLTGWLRRYALSRSILDVPNARSSHTTATPRGGGMAIVVSTGIAIAALAMTGHLSWTYAAGLAGGGGLVAAIGFIDDHGHVPAPWRLLAHFAAAWWLLSWLGGAPPLVVGWVTATWAWQALGALYVVWILNLTNFMDGIDGIASVEALTVCGGGAILAWISGRPDAAAPIAVSLAAAVAGFLVWNWPPAKIFMGDVGSGFIGLMMAALSLQAGRDRLELLWAWTILLAAFVTDATITLVRRAMRRDPIHQAHRTHAYQHAALRYGGHRRVTVAVAAINVVWLFPTAVVVALGTVRPIVGLAIAYAPLIILALALGAGTTQPFPAPTTSASR